MATYYEMLKVQPTASAAEIEAAYETLYNQWRHLATHHELEYRNQASQALETLETVRTTLTDPTRRSAYDAGIGLGGPIGGLADPAALLQAAGPVMTPPAPRTPVSARLASSPSRPGLWACPNAKCEAENPPNTKFCLKCGTQLVRECPECNKTSSLVATGFCGECGYKYDVASQRRDLRSRISATEEDIQRLDNDLASAQDQKIAMDSKRNGRMGWAVILVAGSVILAAAANPQWLLATILLVYSSKPSTLVLPQANPQWLLATILLVLGYGIAIFAASSGALEAKTQSLSSQIEAKETELANLEQSFQQLAVRDASKPQSDRSARSQLQDTRLDSSGARGSGQAHAARRRHRRG